MQVQLTPTGTSKSTWEMDASQAAVDNPAWGTWLHEVVPDVCKALGVNAASSHPKAIIRKILLQKTGSE
jgi:hypothetical protein